VYAVHTLKYIHHVIKTSLLCSPSKCSLCSSGAIWSHLWAK